MPRLAPLLLLLLLGAAHAAADEKPVPRPEPPAEQAADAVLEAVTAKEDAALKSLAENDDPDPCARGRRAARPGPACRRRRRLRRPHRRRPWERLPAYVTAQRGKEPDEVARRALEAANARARLGDWAGVRDLLRGVPGPLDSVPRIRAAYGLGLALKKVDGAAAAFADYLRSGTAAAELGWLTRAATILEEADADAVEAGNWRHLLQSSGAVLLVFEALALPTHAAEAELRVAVALRNLGKYDEALPAAEDARQRFARLEDHGGAGRSQYEIAVILRRGGSTRDAIEAYDRAAGIFEQTKDDASLGATLSGLGVSTPTWANTTVRSGCTIERSRSSARRAI